MQSRPLLETGKADESTSMKLLWFFLCASEARQPREREGADGEVRVKGDEWMFINHSECIRRGQSRWKPGKRGGQIAGVALNFAVDAQGRGANRSLQRLPRVDAKSCHTTRA